MLKRHQNVENNMHAHGDSKSAILEKRTQSHRAREAEQERCRVKWLTRRIGNIVMQCRK